MKKLRKPVYATAGYNTISLGTGRKEFHPKKPRPGIEHYLVEAGKESLKMINDAKNVDEGIVGNFMAARFNKQGHLAALIPEIHPDFKYLPSTRTEGACASGGLALYTAIKSILAETADVVLVIGVEVQNTVKAIYGADILAGAGHYASERKTGHAYFFPSKFDDRAAAYYKKFGQERTRKAMALWYARAIENARKEPHAQEYHNSFEDLVAVGMTPPNPNVFLPNLNVYDCSKVSDGASAIIFASEEGLEKIGVTKADAVQVVGVGQSEDNLTKTPDDLTKLSTTKNAIDKAYSMAGIIPEDIGIYELHDCFTISGLLSMEAAGFAKYGEAPDLMEANGTAPDGLIPTNTTGGLVGFGHYTGGTGVRQAVDVWRQLTGKAADCQVTIKQNKSFGMMSNMGGNDKTVTAIIFKSANHSS